MHSRLCTPTLQPQEAHTALTAQALQAQLNHRFQTALPDSGLRPPPPSFPRSFSFHFSHRILALGTDYSTRRHLCPCFTSRSPFILQRRKTQAKSRSLAQSRHSEAHLSGEGPVRRIWLDSQTPQGVLLRVVRTPKAGF